MPKVRGLTSMMARLALTLSLGLGAPAMAQDETGQFLERCEQGEFREGDERVATLWDTELDMIRHAFDFVIDPKDGMLWVRGHYQRCPVLINDWQFLEIVSADWTTPAKRDEFKLVAQYVTGMGPTGAAPITVETHFTYNEHGWREVSSIVIEREVEPPPEPHLEPDSEPGVKPETQPEPKAELERPGGSYNRPLHFYITDVDQLEKHNRRSNRPAPVSAEDIDFDTHRLVGAHFILTSGSMRLQDIEVRKQDYRYLIYFTLYRPRIGTADIRRTNIYAVLPKDGLPVEFHDRARTAPMGTPVDAPVWPSQ